MQGLIDAVQGNAALVGVALLVLVPIGYIYREFTYPILFHTAEGLVYASVVHLLLHGLVRLAGWFKSASSFEQISVDWTTPLLAPWNMEAYDPAWVFYLNVAAWVGIIYVIVVVRPVGTKNKYRREFEAGGKKGAQGSTPKGSTYSYKGGRAARQQQQQQSVRRRR